MQIFWLTFLKGDVLLFFERFAKLGEVVGRFYNSNSNRIEVVALLGGVVQKFFRL